MIGDLRARYSIESTRRSRGTVLDERIDNVSPLGLHEELFGKNALFYLSPPPLQQPAVTTIKILPIKISFSESLLVTLIRMIILILHNILKPFILYKLLSVYHI